MSVKSKRTASIGTSRVRGVTPKHSIYGSTAIASTFDSYTEDGGITLGQGFQRVSNPSLSWLESKVVGGRFYKQTGLALPGGSLRVEGISGNSAPTTVEATQTIPTSSLVNGWNDILFSTPFAFPIGSDARVWITLRWLGDPTVYISTPNQRTSGAVAAIDGSGLVWNDIPQGLIFGDPPTTVDYVINPTQGYGIDILINEG